MTSAIWLAEERWNTLPKTCLMSARTGSLQFEHKPLKTCLKFHHHRSAGFLATFAASLALVCAARAEPAMWVIRDKDSTIYLIGTAHLLRHEAEWDSTKVKKALAESSELWLEIPNVEDEQAAAPLIQRFGIDKEKRLSQKLNFVEKEKLAKAAADYNIPVQNLEAFKPWAVALLFAVLPLQKAGYDANSGIDRFLQREAKKKGEKIEGFETLEEQVRFLAEFSEQQQLAFLDDTLEDVAEGIAKLDKIAVAWVSGDTKTIDDMLVIEMKAKFPALYDKLIVQRNIQWSERVENILQRSGVQLIAVGVGHLVGADSLQAQLNKRGINPKPY
jgi:uncharacterized protein